MNQLFSLRSKRGFVRLALALGTLAVMGGACPRLSATTLFFSGDLRHDANLYSCVSGCTLGPAASDEDYAQYAGVVDTFNVSATSAMTAITYSYGGGISGNGTAVAAGGLEPYLSLFDAGGNLLASTYFGAYCPSGAGSYQNSCYDVMLDGGTLTPGTYYIALSAFFNETYAENQGVGHLSDGFTGLGSLQPGEDLHYAYDVVLTPRSSPPAVPEPSFVWLEGMALGVPVLRKVFKLRGGKRA